MSDHTIQHVSDTALWVATYRAMETERPDALFRDPYAAHLVGERGRRIAARMAGGSVVRWVVVIRTCFIDELITAAIAEGVDTVLNLGSGLDTRPYRMDLPPALHWVEVDYPHLQEFKSARLAQDTPRCRFERISLDLADVPARRALFTRLNAEAGRVLVLTEGVTPYLTNEAVGSLADDLHAQPKFQLWILDYMAAAHVRRSFGRRRMQHALRNAPIQFKPADWVQFFADHRWRPREFRYYVEEAEKRGRPFKLPWWMRLMVLITPRKRLEKMRRVAGYAVLVPEQ